MIKNKYKDEFVFVCEECKEGIYSGEKYYEINGKRYHRDCLLDNFSTHELLELINKKANTAYEDLILF
ncbi:MAG: LIM domain-containing protein [Eubacteriales bacterium]